MFGGGGVWDTGEIFQKVPAPGNKAKENIFKNSKKLTAKKGKNLHIFVLHVQWSMGCTMTLKLFLPLTFYNFS